MLETALKKRIEEKGLLLMTHIVMGYPSFEAGLDLVETMVGSGVDLMELQIPFSEPVADGPVILRANQKALEAGVTVDQCLRFAGKVTRAFDIPFLIMTYYNIPFKYGEEAFVSAMAERGLQGAIIPDLPPEEGETFLKAMDGARLDPILIYSPTTPDARMKILASRGRGFIYCVARKGVTGRKTAFSEDLETYLARCRRATDLPLAVGFGVKGKEDMDFLKGRADIAVIGTQTIRVMEGGGIPAVGEFLRGLR